MTSPGAAENARRERLRPKWPAELLPGLPRFFSVSLGKPVGRSLRSIRPRGDSGSFCLVHGELQRISCPLRSLGSSSGEAPSHRKPITRNGDTGKSDCMTALCCLADLLSDQPSAALHIKRSLQIRTKRERQVFAAFSERVELLQHSTGSQTRSKDQRGGSGS